MSSLQVSVIIFAFMLCGMLLGFYFRRVLPEQHRQTESKDILTTAASMMATLVALIIGLLVTSAKDTYDATNASITQAGAKIITIDYYLAHYGPEAKEVREILQQTTISGISLIWPKYSQQGANMAKLESSTGMGDVYNMIRELSPKNDAQKYLQSQALALSAEMMQSRWMVIEQSQTKLPMAFLVVLTVWLTVLFAQFGLLSPPNLTAISALFICALSMSGAIFLILELNQPLEGSIKVSSAPLEKALSLIGRAP